MKCLYIILLCTHILLLDCTYLVSSVEIVSNSFIAHGLIIGGLFWYNFYDDVTCTMMMTSLCVVRFGLECRCWIYMMSSYMRHHYLSFNDDVIRVKLHQDHLLLAKELQRLLFSYHLLVCF